MSTHTVPAHSPNVCKIPMPSASCGSDFLCPATCWVKICLLIYLPLICHLHVSFYAPLSLLLGETAGSCFSVSMLLVIE